MNDDLIRRSDAIGAITNHCENECYFRVDNWCPQCQREEFEEAIKAVPSAEITEADVLDYCRPRLLTIVVKEAIPSADRPSGEWIDRGMRVPSSWVKKCSLCGHETDTWRWCKFCPNCGAKMSNASNASNTLATLATLEKGETE